MTSRSPVESIRDFAERLRPEAVDPALVERYLAAALLLIGGLFAARWIRKVVERLVSRRLGDQQTMITARIVHVLIVGVVGLEALHMAGVQLSVLLGAAGLLTVAIGFAAQTSASNLISGLFLMAEKPFVLGDVIEVGTTVGEVVSIDLLSAKLRTFDNLFVRIPNESLLRSEIKNLTRFPIRRLDIPFLVSFRDDPQRLIDVVHGVFDATDLCLDEPAPTVLALGFEDSGLRLRFTVWARREKFIEMKNRLLPAMLRALQDADLEPAVPRRAIESSDTRPLDPEAVDPEAVDPEVDGSETGAGTLEEVP